MSDTKNYFKILNALNVEDKKEQKNGLSYLPWADAWQELKKLYPQSYYTIYETDGGCFYFTDGKTCWVKTGVTVVQDDGRALEHVEYLPVMDHRNKSIPLDAITSTDANKAIQRSLTKACARHGVGLYIYRGEDLPDDAKEAQEKLDQAKAAIISTVQALKAKDAALRDKAVEIIKAHNGSNPNPNSIRDASVADVVLAELKKLEAETK